MEDGSLWIILNRQKTGTASYIPLLDIPVQILDRYKDSEFAGTDGRVFKLQHHVCVNWQLKRLAVNGNKECSDFGIQKCSIFGNNTAVDSATRLQWSQRYVFISFLWFYFFLQQRLFFGLTFCSSFLTAG